ncbi:hypothetical protein DL89DRAFT_269363 [Linderina pennispora]|uniref:SGNH hydrolase n=1 Tax=Linderina pennispora TaxID=61395 RepID=A0A1Y1W2Q7_9FUNG|nr:uncharacterized protein DL89DRAFT_269363 [Linderina pennispora]ORX67565.1 hypothetical protein DL89DRAFT_269363 [Linderina pennispora]
MVCVLGSLAAAAPKTKKTLIIFGDSLSDIGSGWTRMNYDANYQPAPWFMGRYSSGFANFAYGGATSNNTWVNGTVPSIADQLHMYEVQRDAKRFQKPEENIAAIEIGANDIFNSVKKLAIASDKKVEAFATNLTNNVVAAMDKLKGFGLTNFLVFNVAPIEITPRVVELHLSKMVKPVITTINEAYSKAVTEYRQKNKGITVTLVDTSYLTKTIAENLLEDLNIKARLYIAQTPDEYFFMDMVHPTRVPHRLIGYVVAKIIQNPSYNATVDDMRSMIKEHNIRNVYDAVNVVEFQADGKYVNIDTQVAAQATRALSSDALTENGAATPYSLDGDASKIDNSAYINNLLEGELDGSFDISSLMDVYATASATDSDDSDDDTLDSKKKSLQQE